MVKVIKISDEKYKLLLKIAAQLQHHRQEKITIDDALGEVLSKNKNEFSILALAGSWDSLSDADTEILLKDIYAERKLRSRRL